MLPACDVCGVEYVEGYEGPCQEYGAGLTHAQFVRAAERGEKPRSCPGSVSLVKTLERRIVELEAAQ